MKIIITKKKIQIVLQVLKINLFYLNQENRNKLHLHLHLDLLHNIHVPYLT